MPKRYHNEARKVSIHDLEDIRRLSKDLLERRKGQLELLELSPVVLSDLVDRGTPGGGDVRAEDKVRIVAFLRLELRKGESADTIEGVLRSVCRRRKAGEGAGPE